MPYSTAQVIIQLADGDAGDEEYFGPAFDVWKAINDRMISFEFSDHEKKKDELTISLRNDDYLLLENPIFTKGQKLEMTWGWPGEMKPPRRMIVTKVKGGNPIKIICLDVSQLMDKDKNSKDWENATDSEIVIEIARKHGYGGQYLHVQETKIRHDVSQHYTTDARFIARLARKNGFEFYIDASGLHWHIRNVNQMPVKTYIYRVDDKRGTILDEPEIDANLSKGVSRIKVVARDPITKQLWEKFGGPDDTDQETLGLEDEMGNPDDDDQGLRANRLTRVDVRPAGLLTEQEAQNEADARYREVIKGKYKLGLNVIGDGKVGAKSLVDVYGIAPSWDGMFYVKECIDTVEGGKFTQKLKLEKSLLRAVPSTKKRKKGKKEAPLSEATNDSPDDVVELFRRRVLTSGPDGEPAIAIYFTDKAGGGNYGVESWETPSDFGSEDIDLVGDFGAMSLPPDAGQ